jgi:hypothetical protein
MFLAALRLLLSTLPTRKLKENNLLNDNMIKLLNGPVYDPVKLLALLNMQDSAMKTNIEQTIPMLYNTLINHQYV